MSKTITMRVTDKEYESLKKYWLEMIEKTGIDIKRSTYFRMVLFKGLNALKEKGQ